MKKLRVRYRSQEASWIDGTLFEQYMKWFDKYISKTDSNRKQLFFLDNAVHKSALDELERKHTKAHYK